MKRTLVTLLIPLLTLLAPALGQGFDISPEIPVEIVQRLHDDLDFLRSLRGGQASPLHEELFGPRIHGESYLSFFNRTVENIAPGSHPFYVAYVLDWATPSTIYITDRFIHGDFPQIARAMMLIHESRHTGKTQSQWDHVLCPDPYLDEQGQERVSFLTGRKLSGGPGCDDTVYGSYGVTAIFLKNLQAKCENCTDKVKMDAGLYGDDQAIRLVGAEAPAAFARDLRALKDR